MKYFNKFLNNFEEIIVGLCVISTLFFIFLTVILRYLFNIVLTWPDELSRFLNILMIWVGASIAFRKNSQLKIDLFSHLFPSAKRFGEIVANLISLICCILLLIAAYKAVHNKWVTGEASMVLNIPLWIVTSSVILGTILMIIRLIQNIIFNYTLKEN
ncbi:MAG: TRAP transporter small permease [Deltaproteobacteria bacterium]|nr:TRAP transporter small permease [Deltaproteobacteria bacterium]